MAKEYAELTGGAGRSVYFRSERYRSRALLSELRSDVDIAGLSGQLYDISMNGLSVMVARDATPPAEGALVPVRVSLAGVEAFAGNGRVVRVDSEGRARKVALAIEGDFIDIPRLSALHDRLAFERALERGADAYNVVPAGYAEAVSKVNIFLSHWASLLDAREERMRDDGATAEEVLAVEMLAEARMRVEWQALRLRANEAALACFGDPNALRAAKRLTELTVTPLLRPAPLWWDAYTKPLGYPGDFRMMNYMYDGTRRGGTMFARVMHQLGREERLAWTVTSRKQLMIDQLGAAVLEVPGDGVVRLASIASGPAREIEEFLLAYDGARPLHWTLIDQDERSLSYAYERLIRASHRHRDRIEIQCLYTSFRQLIATPELLDTAGNQDFIYSAGFFDYLDDATAARVADRCVKLLRPGGRALFGNAATGPDVHWVPEFVLDWKLTYRTREDLLRVMPTDGVRDARPLLDSSGAWHFVELWRIDPTP